MALFLRQDEDQSKLQQKINTSLSTKIGKMADNIEPPQPAQGEQAQQHQTRFAGVVIAVLLVLLLGAIVFAVNRL